MKFKTLFKILAGILLFIAVERFCHRQTAGFAVNWTSSDLILDSQICASLSDEDRTQLSAILNQKFRFLGSGGTFYAFVSEDDQYVVKFFKHHHLKWDKTKKERIVRSIKVAYESFKNETGLLYVHLQKVPIFHSSLTITDKIGIKHQIDLSKTEFLVQKKATMIHQTLDNLMQRGEIDAAKQTLNKLITFCRSLMRQLNEKGYFDHDPNILTNYGVLDGQIIKIDVGPFYSMDNPKAKKQIDKLNMHLQKFQLFLNEDYPELAASFAVDLEKVSL